MAVKRFNRDQFFARLAEMDEASVQKALWTAYWRGSASTRERIEAAIDPGVREEQRVAAQVRPDAEGVLQEVTDFAKLARSGAYLAGDRRVSPKERTRWRFTFRRLATEVLDSLSGEDVDNAASAMATLIDLACEMRGYDYFRSEDPVEAARFVVSDAAAALWSRTLQAYGFAGFAERAAPQLVRWESRHGWSRFGEGWVRQRETTLAHVLAELLPVPDSWGDFADQYLRALDRAVEVPRSGGRRGTRASWRAEELRDWNLLLAERLAGSEYEDRLDTLVGHPALAGHGSTELRAYVHGRDRST